MLLHHTHKLISGLFLALEVILLADFQPIIFVIKFGKTQKITNSCLFDGLKMTYKDIF